ncbi:hypothetical protein [Rubrimonas cliftonensis]|nr:hypothetical protein [Rubrimonas cliftonensis]
MDIARKLSGDLVTGEYLDGGLPRHVVTDNAKRDLPFEAPPNVTERLAKPSQARNLADALTDSDLADREALQSQVIAAALALGDMSMKFKEAELDLLAYDGEPIERAAMAFHHDGTVHGGGAALDVRAPDGSPATFVAEEGGYKTFGGSGLFTVNAAPAKPGAPFADPCGAPTGMGRLSVAGLMLEQDPFVAGLLDPTFAPDPAVIGYRRYEASAVQVDLITNRAGWHDPQARINVLTAKSDDYKDGKGRISPKVTASEEPFFFRALSGECIEFRHTNELPKELELDDFQVKTPTDTIGQHIHLVKFDVTSSDGSGNGFNYEDGTFAPDEIAVRICAAKNTPSASDVTSNRAPGELAMREFEGLCVFDEKTGLWKVSSAFDKQIWRMKRGAQPDLFQTTTQRWFADPILSDIRAPDDGAGAQAGNADRTLRTVFSHDHFGPSSIQQHGFYTALLIEPATAQICDDSPLSCTAPRADRSMIVAGEADIGARKVIVNLTPEPGDLIEYREYALSIADFALLYDPRDTMSAAEIDTLSKTLADEDDIEALAARERRMKGMVTLFCEARYGIAKSAPRMEAFCDSALGEDSDGFWFAEDGDTPPAWLAAARPGDRSDHKTGLTTNLLADLRVIHKGASLAADDYLLKHLTEYRAAAAGYAADDPRARLASPVAPPQRPESISVDHHDPYLINYRGEPLPLRIGVDSSASPDCNLKAKPEDWVSPLLSGVTERCSISRQRPGDEGDFANVMLSALHGDPATPIIEAFDGDHLQFRLIQGAQEVQHTFTLEGYTWPRNVDQAFPAAQTRPWQDDTPVATLARRCELEGGPLSGVRMASAGRPDQYRAWQRHGWQGFSATADRNFWRDMEEQIALCFNNDGRIAAQEVGISEHFEFESAFLYDTNFEAVAKELVARAEARTGETVSAATRLEDVRALQRLTRLQLRTLDTPYHFGSQDALWNGAWGLVRVGAKTRRFELFRALERDLSERAVELESLTRDDPGAIVPDALRRRLDPLLADPLGQTLRRRPELGPDAALLTAPRALRSAPPAEPTQEPREGGADEEGAVVQPLTRFRNEAIDAIEAAPPDQLAPLVERLERAGRVEIEDLTAQRLAELFGRLRTPPDPETAIPDYRPVAECEPGAPRVYAAIVAIEAETVFRGTTPSGQPGTPYSEELLDGNGLFFALVDPRALVDPERPERVTDVQIEDRANWTAIPLPRIVDLIRATYHRPEPLVINVNAGDCVHMTVLNALRSRRGASPGLSDIPGDANMTPIVSLDVERAWSENERPDGTIFATAGTDRRRDAIPSARLALSFPLPVLTRQSAYARPYGDNPVWALAGVDRHAAEMGTAVLSIEDRPDLLEKPGPRLAQIEQLEFYAGLVYAPAGIGTTAPLRVSDAVNILLPDLILTRLGAEGGPTLPDGVARLPARPELGAADAQILGEQIVALQEDRAVVTERLAQTLDGALLEPGASPALEPMLRDPALRARITPQRVGPTPPTAPADGDPASIMAIELSVGPRLEDRIVLPMADAIDVLRAGGVIDAETQRRVVEIGDRALSDYVGRVQALNQNIFEYGTLAKLDANHLPYAFGALPLKSFGDVIGHPTHGLVGAVTVAPRGARATELRAPRTALGCDNKLIGPRGVRPALRLSDIRPEIAAEWLRAPGVVTRCDTFVIAPQPLRGAAQTSRPMWTARLDVVDPNGARHAIRQFTLFWQDGLNLRDPGSDDAYVVAGIDLDLMKDCKVCDDSYDFGDKGASYRSEPFHVRLRDTHSFPLESHSDLNRAEFGDQFFRLKPKEIPTWDDAPVPVLRAAAGEEVVVHVVHPGGRARQRAFATIGQDYNDLFPSFGFPRAALLAPGKAITVSLTKPAEPGCYLWFDGPLHLRAGGVWGLLDVVEDIDDPEATSCARRPE